MGSEFTLDIGTFFTVIFGVLNLIVVAILGWIMKDLRDLSRDHRVLKDTVQTNYATKQELLRLENSISVDIHEIKGLIAEAVKEFKSSTTRIHDRIDIYIERLTDKANGG